MFNTNFKFEFKQFLAGAAATVIVLGATAPAIAQATDFSATSFESGELLLANAFEDEFKKNRGELLRKLNLSNSQKQEIQAIRNRYSGQMNSLKTEMKDARQTMRSLAESNASRSQLETQYNVNRGLRNEFADLKFQQMLDIREVLTVAQRQQMAEFIEEKMQERGGFFGN